MTEFVLSTFGESQSKIEHGRSMRERVADGVFWEFGPKARVEFPDPRSIRLICGKTVVELHP
jgi:hypothetical protein